MLGFDQTQSTTHSYEPQPQITKKDLGFTQRCLNLKCPISPFHAVIVSFATTGSAAERWTLAGAQFIIPAHCGTTFALVRSAPSVDYRPHDTLYP
jgi:hypothetical protein